MEYPFMYVPVCTIHLVCTAQPSGAHGNEVHVYIGVCMVVEYRASENVTLVQSPFVVHICRTTVWYK